MSKYRCPRCGATHKDPVPHCRLCGCDMTGDHTPVGPTRRAPKKDRGLAPLVIGGVVGVVAISVLALVLGLNADTSGVEDLTGKIPGVGGETADGWRPLEDADGGFVASLPGTATQTETAFAPAESGKATTWTTNIADEIRITVAYAFLPAAAEGETPEGRLIELADEWATAADTSVRTSELSAFAGLPARDTVLRSTDLEAGKANAKAFLFLRENRLYVVMVESIYLEMPQYTRVLASMELT